ncbi:MAG TPA: ester cyclase, partial [Roseiflexaceae bacterium]|nr:ester cyclase [Roseiflexaceae bacterium]
VIAEFNRGDWRQLVELFAPDLSYTETGTGRSVSGAEPYIQLLQGWRHVFPDCTGTILATVAEDATVVHQVSWEGTQAAALPTPGGEVPNRGRRITVPATLWYTISDNRVTAIHHYLDMLTLLQQLGAFESAPA